MSNQTHRVLELIRRFNANQTVCIDQLQREYLWEGKSDKTIRRDLDIIKEMFADTYHRVPGHKGCYKAITHALMAQIMGAQNLSLLAQSLHIAERTHLLDDLGIDPVDERILKKQIDETKDIYLFKTKPFENHATDPELLKTLELAIYHRRELDIVYIDLRQHTETLTIKPYKIVFMNENFYLASEIANRRYRFSPLRIARIQSAKTTGNNFHQNQEIATFIKEMQTPKARYEPDYRAHQIDVRLTVSRAKASFFREKRFLPSQTILSDNPNGTLEIGYTITHEAEILDLILRWLPHLRVVSPVSLDETVKGIATEYLALTS
jgi:predicted DNA-binding transcriptional regulator YafY